MAFSAITTRGSAVETASDASIGVSPSANLTAGKFVTVTVHIKNIATADGASNTVTGVADNSSQSGTANTWRKDAEYTETEAGAGNDGSTVAVFSSVLTRQIQTTDTITATLSGSIGDKIITVTEVTVGTGVNDVIAEQVGLGPNAIAASVSSLPSREYYLFGAASGEGSDQTKTADADYLERFDLRSQNAASAITCHVQTRIATLTADTVTSTAWTATQPYTVLIAYREAVNIAAPVGGVRYTGAAPDVSATFPLPIPVGALAVLALSVGVMFAGPDGGQVTVTGHALYRRGAHGERDRTDHD
jgi:hypothetical protein